MPWGILETFYYMVLKIVLFDDLFKLKNHSAMRIICILIWDFKMLESLCFLSSGKKGLQKIPKPLSYMKINKGVLKNINSNQYSGTYKNEVKRNSVVGKK